MQSKYGRRVFATAMVCLAAIGCSSNQVAGQAVRFVPIGSFPSITDSSPTVWGMSGMEIFKISHTAGKLTPIVRSQMMDARLVEILSRTQSPPVQPSDVNVVTLHGRVFVTVRSYLLAEVLDKDAKAARTSMRELASRWAEAMRRLLPEIAP
jgi:hypothetical protein